MTCALSRVFWNVSGTQDYVRRHAFHRDIRWAVRVAYRRCDRGVCLVASARRPMPELQCRNYAHRIDGRGPNAAVVSEELVSGMWLARNAAARPTDTASRSFDRP